MAPQLRAFKLVGESDNDQDPTVQVQTMTYMAHFDNPDNEPIDISQDLYADVRVPVIFALHNRNPNLFVVNRRARQLRTTPNVFEVTFDYSNQYVNSAGAGQQGQPDQDRFRYIENPLDRPANIEWDTYRRKELFTLAYGDNETRNVPIQTTAGESFSLDDDVSNRVIRVSKNIQRINPIFATELDFINKDRVRMGSGNNIVFDPDTLWLTDVRISSLKIENRVPYYEMSYSLYHNPDTWIRKARNQGFHERIEYQPQLPRNPRDPRGPQFGPKIAKLVRIKLSEEYPTTPIPIISQQLLDAQAGGGIQFVSYDGSPAKVGEAVRLKDANGKVHIIGPGTDAAQGLSERFWDANMLKFRLKKRLRFTGNIPMR